MFENVGRKVFVVAALVLTSILLLVLKDEPFNLGLDLKGGTRLVYSVDFDQAIEDGTIGRNEDKNQILDQMIDIIRSRVDPKGVREPSIRRTGDERILIELPGTLGLPTVESKGALKEDFDPTTQNVLALVDASEFPNSGKISIAGGPEIRYDGKDGFNLVGLTGAVLPYSTGDEVTLKSDDAFRQAIESLGELSFRIVVERGQLTEYGTDLESEREKARVWAEANPNSPLVAFNRLVGQPNGPHERIRWYPARPGPGQESWTEEQLAQAVFAPESSEEDFRGKGLQRVYPSTDQLGYPAVGFEFKAARRGDFADFTGKYTNRVMAIVLNDEIASTARIQDELPGGGIIQGRFTNEEVKGLITVLRSGSLKVKPNLEYDERVGATLGDDYVRRGSFAAMLALALVLVFMVVYYRRLGIYAAISLAVAFLLLTGGLSFLNATLTLPGIAGIILTVGMAVDANILIFDRIREEMDKGRNIKQAAKNGFEMATSAILDANITTFLTAVILYVVGTGPVRGFAVTLMVGILASVFAALIVTRLFVHFALVKGKPQYTMGTWMVTANYKFLDKAKVAFGLSALVILASLGLFFTTADTEKLGIDFVGGAEAQLRMEEPQSVDVIRDRVAAIDGPIGESAEVKPILDSGSDGAYKEFRVTVKKAGDADLSEAGNIRGVLQNALSELLLQDAIDVSVVEQGDSEQATVSLFFEEGHPAADIAARLATIGLQNAEVTLGEGTTYTAVATTAFGRTADEIESRLEAAFQGVEDSQGTPFALAAAVANFTQISPQVVGELRDKALLALAISLFVIVLYIRVRFAEYSYGYAAVAALLHDVLITLGALTLANKLGIINGEISLPMIAAFLTIIGYSLNDTIVIFDRVRENLPRMQKPLKDVLDTSINQTLSRTILTSFTTFVAVAVMFAFNFGTGNVMESFSFAMMIGVLCGTYSTIFIANPVLLWLESRSGHASAPSGDKGDKKELKAAGAEA